MVVGMELSMGGVSEPWATLKAKNKIERPRTPQLNKLPASPGPAHQAWTTL